jgi:RND family efflux transporter MFP subunit
MNTLTEHDRRLAETLKSLALEPLAETRGKRHKAIYWIAGALLLSAIPVVFMLASPAAINDMKTTLMGWLEPVRLDDVREDAAPSENSSDKPLPTPTTSQAADDEIAGSGYVVTPRAVAVYAKYEGTVMEMAVDVGDRVEAGQILAVMADASARFGIEQAEATKASTQLVLASREIALAQASTWLRRAEALARRDAVSKKDFEEAETAWKNALNTVEQARQELVRADIEIRVARERLDALIIRAPFAGTVMQVNANIGDAVLARADSVRESQSILALADTTAMVIDADIAETNISSLRPGLRGEAILDGFPDQPFGVVLQRIAPAASSEKGTIGVRLSLIDPPVGMRPNMSARIRIVISETQGQIGDVSP